MSIKAYKGFNRDMTCRGFRYKEGGEYETDRAVVCESGFHACENPIDCLQYYEPHKSVYHKVELDGDIDRKSDGDTKVAATKIKIGASVPIAGLIKAAVDFALSKIKPTTGYAAHAATTGYAAHAATTGYAANAATTGDAGTAEVKDGDAVAVVTGKNCKARGGAGSWLVLTERDDNWHILGVKAICVDGKKYKPDTWYTLKGGKVVKSEEAEDGE